MLIDLQVKNREALVIGGGKLGERKAVSLLENNAHVTVISKSLTSTLKTLAEDGKITYIEADLSEEEKLLTKSVSKAFIVFAATDNRDLNKAVSVTARNHGVLVCAVDMPDICDFYSPALIQRGSISVGISTDGKSPLMSKALRQRLEESITSEDANRVEVQHYARELSKSIINNPEQSREALYRINDDPHVNQYLKLGQIDEAKHEAEVIIRKKAAQYTKEIT